MIKHLTKIMVNKLGYDIIPKEDPNDIAHYLQLFDQDSVLQKRFYNVSGGGHFGFGGGFYHPCWTNVDYFEPSKMKPCLNPKGEIAHDLLSMAPLPLASASAELVQTQYTIEHITDQASAIMFEEVYRILKPNGILRVVVPNIELDFLAYKNKDRHYFHWIDMFSSPKIYKKFPLTIPLNLASLEQIFLVHFAANASAIHNDGAKQRIDDAEFQEIMQNNVLESAINLCTQKCSVEKQKLYRHNHINGWTNKKLIAMLNRAGFEKTYTLSSNQSTSPVMRNNYYFDRYWNNVALFIEAVK